MILIKFLILWKRILKSTGKQFSRGKIEQNHTFKKSVVKVLQKTATLVFERVPRGIILVLSAHMTHKRVWRWASYQSTSLQMTGSSNCEDDIWIVMAELSAEYIATSQLCSGSHNSQADLANMCHLHPHGSYSITAVLPTNAHVRTCGNHTYTNMHISISQGFKASPTK